MAAVAAHRNGLDLDGGGVGEDNVGSLVVRGIAVAAGSEVETVAAEQSAVAAESADAVVVVVVVVAVVH